MYTLKHELYKGALTAAHFAGVKSGIHIELRAGVSPHHWALSLCCVLRPGQVKLDLGQSVLDCYETEG